MKIYKTVKNKQFIVKNSDKYIKNVIQMTLALRKIQYSKHNKYRKSEV